MKILRTNTRLQIGTTVGSSFLGRRLCGRVALSLAMLLACFFGIQGIATAQSATAVGNVPAAVPVTATLQGKVSQSSSDSYRPQELPAKASPGLAPAHSADGSREGIHVYGYWKLDVKDPDGAVVKHVEFENALQSTGTYPLAALLQGNAVSGGLAIGLNLKTASPYSNGNLTGNGPCGATIGCLIYAPKSLFDTACAFDTAVNNTPSAGCSPSLTVTAPSPNTNQAIGAPEFVGTAQIQLSGSATAGVASTITDVETFFAVCGVGSLPNSPVTTQVCQQFANPPDIYTFIQVRPVAQSDIFTLKNLDGTLPACTSSVSDPCPVSVNAGQSISVAVTISFQ